jgi:hypothetical protein
LSFFLISFFVLAICIFFSPGFGVGVARQPTRRSLVSTAVGFGDMLSTQTGPPVPNGELPAPRTRIIALLEELKAGEDSGDV